MVLIVDQNNEVSDLVLYTLGLRTEELSVTELAGGHTSNGEAADADGARAGAMRSSAACSFKLVGWYDKYVYDAETQAATPTSPAPAAGLDYLYDNEDVGITLKISGIVRQNEDAVAGMMQAGALGYTAALVEEVISGADDSDIIVDQLANPDVDVLTGLPFRTGDEPSPRLRRYAPRPASTYPSSTRRTPPSSTPR